MHMESRRTLLFTIGKGAVAVAIAAPLLTSLGEFAEAVPLRPEP
jgi:hypothetical protein